MAATGRLLQRRWGSSIKKQFDPLELLEQFHPFRRLKQLKLFKRFKRLNLDPGLYLEV